MTRLEEWRDAVGHEDFFEISSHGRCRRKARVTTNTLGRRQSFPARIMKGCKHPTGYTYFCLKYGETYKLALAHRMVALAFLGHRDKGQQVNHKDSNKTNNHVSNLEWVSPKENIAHSAKQGIRQASTNPNYVRKLTFEQAQEIRTLIASKVAWDTVAEQFSISPGTISSIVRLRTHVPQQQFLESKVS